MLSVLITMFGGYEVAQYLTPDVADDMNSGQDEEVPARLVPHKYNLTRKCNPWSWMLCEDHVLLGECSELEGPKPLHIIKQDKLNKDFDANHFTVKIMAVDTQAVKSNYFHLSDDMSVLLIEDTCETYAYVHHFTLYDTEARGFVRPFCMAYVSSDKEKMCDHYESIRQEFYMVSQIYHSYNMRVFKSDLENRVEDLKFTRACFLKSQNGIGDDEFKDIFKGVMLSNIDNLLQEAVAAYNVVQSSYQWRDFNWHGSSGSFGCGDSSSINSQLSKREPCVLDVRNWKRFDFRLRSLDELCRGGADEGLYTLESIHKHFNRSSMMLHLENFEKSFGTPSASVVTFGQILTGNLHFPLGSNKSCTTGVVPNSHCSSASSGTVESFKSADDQCEDTVARETEPSDGSAMCPSAGSFQLISSLDDNVVETSDTFTNTSQLFSEFSGCVECSKSETKRRSESFLKSSILHVNDLSWTSPGYGLLTYMNHFPFLLDVIYALMRGSSVVVMGTHERDNELAPLLKALSIFVPTNKSAHHHIIADMDRLSQALSKYKLVGCIRRTRHTKDIESCSYKDDCVLVDLEKKSCTAPSYRAGLLSLAITSKKKQFKNEHTFLSYVHCILLEYVMKAFLFVHRQVGSKNSKKDPLLELTPSDSLIVQGLVKAVRPPKS